MNGSLYALSLALDANEEPDERRRLAWQMLAMCRQGKTSLHADYVKLYRQRAATALAELVALDDAKLLITEAEAVRVGKDEQTAMTGSWDTAEVAKKLDAAQASSRKP